MHVSRSAVIMVLATLLAMPATAVPHEVVTTHDLRLEGGALHGDIDLVQVRGGMNGAALAFVIHAAEADVDVYERTALPLADGFNFARVPLGQTHHDWHDVSLERRGDVESGFSIALDVDGEGWMAADDATIEHADGVFLSEQGIRERQARDASSADDSDDFRDIARDGPHGIGRAWQQAHNGTWRGDAVIEFRGIDLEGRANGEDVRLASGTEDGPGPTRADYFVRMHLRGAVITLDAPKGSIEQTSWAAPAAHASGQEGARLTIPMGSGEEAGSRRVLVDAPFDVAIDTTKEHFTLTFEDPATAPAASIYMPEAIRGPLGTASLIVVALMAVAAVVVTRHRRTPRLDDIERALERGDHAAAARHAGRLVAKRPELEGARIAQAIAMTKSGDPQGAVRTVRAFLDDSAPSDGVLYYVLGTALMELGRGEEARQAFRDAVALTPQLLDEVGPLPPRGDAQAYA